MPVRVTVTPAGAYGHPAGVAYAVQIIQAVIDQGPQVKMTLCRFVCRLGLRCVYVGGSARAARASRNNHPPDATSLLTPLHNNTTNKKNKKRPSTSLPP